MRSVTNYHAGLAAETRVADDYMRRAHSIPARRWRGSQGEIDIVAEAEDGSVVFVEVKKSRSFAAAAERLTRRQMDRIYSAASEYLALCPKGQMTEARFDVALVNGKGQMQIIENAFAA